MKRTVLLLNKLIKWSICLQGFGGGWNFIHGSLPSICLLQAKKRQIQLDTTYGSSMRELELLLDSFQIEKPEEHKRPGDPSCILIQ